VRCGPVRRGAQKLLLWFSPSDLTRRTFKGLLSAFEIWPGFETVPLDKIGFVGVQQMPIERERDELQFVFKDDSVHRGLISSTTSGARRSSLLGRRLTSIFLAIGATALSALFLIFLGADERGHGARPYGFMLFSAAWL
jgi:hypothetical protein